MSTSTHQIAIKARDNTGPAFDSISKRARSSGGSISKILGGALAAVGAYMSFRSAINGIKELGRLSDIAQKTSTNVGELTRMTAAFGALGVNMSVDGLAKSMAFMSRTTGRSGMEGFYKTIGEIAKVPDVAERGKLAIQAFGRSGWELTPLINAGAEGVEALRAVADAMPEIPQSAASAGDAVSDAMGFAADQAKSIWMQGLGLICGWFDNQFKGGVREASLAAGNYVEYYTRVGVAKAITYFKKAQEYFKRYGDAVGTFIGAKIGGETWEEAWRQAGEAYDLAVEDYKEVAAELDRIEAGRLARFERKFEDRKTAIEKFQQAYEKAAKSVKRNSRAIAREEQRKTATRITNELVLGGSNAALKMQILGPSFQSEQKKQTSYLEKIAAATQKTAANTENDGESLHPEVLD